MNKNRPQSDCNISMMKPDAMVPNHGHNNVDKFKGAANRKGEFLNRQIEQKPGKKSSKRYPMSRTLLSL